MLLRGAQEALTNVRRHAAAPQRRRPADRRGGGAVAPVSVHVDDGVGFDPAPRHGSGLDGLRGRVESVGGDVDVVSAPGRGTRCGCAPGAGGGRRR